MIWVGQNPLTNKHPESGYMFNLTVILQFHPIIVTRADQVPITTSPLSDQPLFVDPNQGLDISCLHRQPISQQELELTSQRRLLDSQCSYRLHRFGPDNCIALDAKVGESLFHKWECEAGEWSNWK